jgi:uncharacterized caspase-like protein
MATADERLALEGYEGHGVFTWALLQALNGRADTNTDGIVELAELAGFVITEVENLTEKIYRYRQVPQWTPHGDMFPLVRIE